MNIYGSRFNLLHTRVILWHLTILSAFHISMYHKVPLCDFKCCRRGQKGVTLLLIHM